MSIRYKIEQRWVRSNQFNKFQISSFDRLFRTVKSILGAHEETISTSATCDMSHVFVKKTDILFCDKIEFFSFFADILCRHLLLRDDLKWYKDTWPMNLLSLYKDFSIKNDTKYIFRHYKGTQPMGQIYLNRRTVKIYKRQTWSNQQNIFTALRFILILFKIWHRVRYKIFGTDFFINGTESFMNGTEFFMNGTESFTNGTECFMNFGAKKFLKSSVPNQKPNKSAPII